ncbi:MAG: hypothetical protein AABX86_02025 [Nanoarchaeota archaeon]
MGKSKHLNQIEELLEKSPVIDFRSIQRRIRSKAYAKLLVNQLRKKEKILKLAKGCYTKHKEISLAVFCFQPAYLGLQSALSYHGIWEQETIPVILTAKKVRTGIRKVDGNNSYIRRLKGKYVFGFTYEQEGEFYLPYADLEKTFIDMVIFRQRMDEEVIRKIKEKLNAKKLRRYLKKYPRRTREKISKILKNNELLKPKPKAI